MSRNREVAKQIKKAAEEVVKAVDLFEESTSVESDDDFEDEKEERETCVLQFGLDPIVVAVEDPPQTVRQAFISNQEELNYDPSRGVTFKVNGALIDGETTVSPGALYVANVTGEKKGA